MKPKFELNTYVNQRTELAIHINTTYNNCLLKTIFEMQVEILAALKNTETAELKDKYLDKVHEEFNKKLLKK